MNGRVVVAEELFLINPNVEGKWFSAYVRGNHFGKGWNMIKTKDGGDVWFFPLPPDGVDICSITTA